MSNTTIRFSTLPFVVRLATLMFFYMAWVMFAEFIVDRHGLDAYMPFYKVGNFCPWDVAVLGMLAVAWWRLHAVK